MVQREVIKCSEIFKSAYHSPFDCILKALTPCPARLQAKPAAQSTQADRQGGFLSSLSDGDATIPYSTSIFINRFWSRKQSTFKPSSTTQLADLHPRKDTAIAHPIANTALFILWSITAEPFAICNQGIEESRLKSPCNSLTFTRSNYGYIDSRTPDTVPRRNTICRSELTRRESLMESQAVPQ